MALAAPASDRGSAPPALRIDRPHHLIGLAGLAGSGKDTLAAVLVEAGWTHLKFTTVLKDMLRLLLSAVLHDAAQVERMVDGDLKAVPTPVLGGRTPRHAMQTLGTEWGRQLISPDFWVKLIEYEARHHRKVVISDVRFPNEVDMIHRLNGEVALIDRGLSPRDTHASEAMSDVLMCDLRINNHFATAEAFQEWGRTVLLPFLDPNLLRSAA